MRRLLRALLEQAGRALVESLRRRAARRAMESLDGCDFCGEDGEFFVDVTPKARHMAVRLACTPCAAEATRHGAQVLIGSDGRPVERR